MLSKLLLATAFDPLSEQAAEHALRLAQATGARCHVVHAIEPIDADGAEVDEFYAGLEQKTLGQLEAVAARFREAGIDCASTVRVGRRWEVILDVAAEDDADLIVLGSRPTVSGERTHLGTTSHQVFFAARRPLLVVRGDRPADA